MRHFSRLKKGRFSWKRTDFHEKGHRGLKKRAERVAILNLFSLIPTRCS